MKKHTSSLGKKTEYYFKNYIFWELFYRFNAISTKTEGAQIILNWDCREGLTERVTLEPRLKRHEGTIMRSEEEYPRQRKLKPWHIQEPWEVWRNGKKTSTVGREFMRNRVVTANSRNEIRMAVESHLVGHCKGFPLNKMTNQWRVLP